MASLRELQQSFAAALRDPSVPCAVQPVTRLDVYRNNVEHQFRRALELGYPVLRRRVGEDYFRQLAHFYRRDFPSRSGDLFHVGEHFASFLDGHLRDGDYAWLADLARLEWARGLAAISEWREPVGAEALAGVAPEDLERLVFELQPSLRLVTSAYPVFSVWLANQQENAPPVDQSAGSEHGLVLGRHDGVDVRVLDPALFSYLCVLAGGGTLGAAMTQASLDEAGVLRGLQFLFAESLVTAVAVA